jgi:hypothetical protein
MTAQIQAWVGEILGLPEDMAVQVREEPHCPDPTCPLRRTVIQWTDKDGQAHHVVIVKPLAYIRRSDVESALRLFAAKG